MYAIYKQTKVKIHSVLSISINKQNRNIHKQDDQHTSFLYLNIVIFLISCVKSYMINKNNINRSLNLKKLLLSDH